jgi:hypothetical protein
VVRNQEAFEARHGVGLPIAGEFEADTGLANGGERLRIADDSGTTIRDFTYNDKHPWPESTDGAGFSLVLINPTSNPDHDLASSWRSSSMPGGSPGTGDASIFVGNPDADDDGDGLSNWMNHALGGSGAEFAPNAVASGAGIIFTHRRNLAADDVALSIESSPDLEVWTPLLAPSDAEVSLGDGTSAMMWNVPATTDRSFVRLRAGSR